MKLDKIRNMNDTELRDFLTEIQQRKMPVCAKCGDLINKDKRVISITKNYAVRKLCTLCLECYVDLLDYLGISDIDWED